MRRGSLAITRKFNGVNEVCHGVKPLPKTPRPPKPPSSTHNSKMYFKREYLNDFHVDENYFKAEKLWLWYDYHTEQFDSRLFNTVESPNDPDCRIPVSVESRALSSKNARNLQQYIYDKAKDHELDDKTMQAAKMNSQRGRKKIRYEKDLYEAYFKNGEFDFMNGRYR